ncbi:DUF3973 domain-containing protein [Paenibacillus gyeongsangnamensis]|uniref:DUF3973 domain-containing protein n=1 Tax=Paenibacillus gyeongsangnamensis TaxID=3388067 RepID=UPI00390809D2
MYYCLECAQIHDRGYNENELVFNSGFFTSKGVIYPAGLCREQQVKQLQNDALDDHLTAL